jgi:hypothetical protein
LELPAPSADEEAISKTTVYTNRAPLVLAFAVQLLKYTMPEQPLSSRLSLAQAVVSANSRSRAYNLGIEKNRSAEMEGWGAGQPKVRVLGREVHVLKRSGYDWRSKEETPTSGEEQDDLAQVKGENDPVGVQGISHSSPETKIPINPFTTQATWTVSQPVTLKKSTFIARSTPITSAAQAKRHLVQLLASNASLRDASHNISAFRVAGPGGIVEESNDDGESGGGSHVLQLMQQLGVTGTLVVVTRWYGGIMLGTDRWKLMSQVCRESLAQRLRVVGTLGSDALWGLDVEGMREGKGVGGMPVHKPEGARAYIMKAFASAEGGSAGKKKGVALEREKEMNLGLVLGALDLLFASWVEHISRDELDRRAWGWYVQVRPEVESGAAGWGGKGEVKLLDILSLRRKG